ncbi:MAG: hypothetical protein WBB31_01185 [Saprospiraceae bacterium]
MKRYNDYSFNGNMFIDSMASRLMIKKPAGLLDHPFQFNRFHV